MQRTRRAITRCVVPVLAVAVLGVAAVAVAAPNQPKSIFPNPNTDNSCDKNQGLCRTDNTAVTYYSYTSLDSAARTRVDNMMAYAENNTVSP